MTQPGHFHKTSFNISQENKEKAQRKGMKNKPHARSGPHAPKPDCTSCVTDRGAQHSSHGRGPPRAIQVRESDSRCDPWAAPL